MNTKVSLTLHRKHTQLWMKVLLLSGHHPHVISGIEAHKQGLIQPRKLLYALAVEPGDIGIIPIVQFDAKSHLKYSLCAA